MSGNKKTPQDVRDQGGKKSFSEWVEENFIVFFSVPVVIGMLLISLSLFIFALKL